MGGVLTKINNADIFAVARRCYIRMGNMRSIVILTLICAIISAIFGFTMWEPGIGGISLFGATMLSTAFGAIIGGVIGGLYALVERLFH